MFDGYHPFNDRATPPSALGVEIDAFVKTASDGEPETIGRTADGFGMEKPPILDASKKNLWASTGNLCASPPLLGKKKHSQEPSSTKKLVPSTKKRGDQ